MLHTFNKKPVLIGSLILMSISFVFVMFFVNPSIDGGNGTEVIKLQLSFDKEVGTAIINGWGKSGIENFKRWIFTDYIYAFAYAVFFASLLSVLILKKGMGASLVYRGAVYLAFASGFFDWVENTIELSFVSNPSEFSSILFFLHSIVAVVKWAAVPIAVAYIVILLSKTDEPNMQNPLAIA